MLYNTNTKQRITESSFRTQHPNTSFPTQLTDEVLAKFGVAILHYPEEPTPKPGFKIVEDGEELIDGKWTVKFAEFPFTTEEIETLTESVRNQRNARLTRSDWTQLPDAPITTEQKDAWIVYRQELRDITDQQDFPLNIIWPTQP